MLSGSRLTAVVQPFRRRDFSLLWAALAVSLIGDSIWLVAIPWQIISSGEGPASLAIVVGAGTVGILVSLFAGGVLADALPRRTILWVSSATSFVITAALVCLAFAGQLNVLWMAVAAFLLAALDGIAGPASEALLPTLVGEETLRAANGLESFLTSVANRAIGPTIGGIVVVALGPVGALMLDAASFLVAAALFALMRGGRTPAAPDTTLSPRSIVSDFAHGARFVATTRWLWAGIGFAGVVLLFQVGPRQVLLPFLVAGQFGGSSVGYGLLLAAYGIGATTGAVTAASMTGRQQRMGVLYTLWALGSLPLVAVPFVPTLWMAGAALLISGIFLSMGNIVWSTLMQIRVPDAIRGRVSSIDWFGSLALFPVSVAIAGTVTSPGGVDLSFVLAGAVPAVLAGIVYFGARLYREEADEPALDNAIGDPRPSGDLDPSDPQT